MSYNIDSVEMLESDITMRYGDLMELHLELEGWLPECNFLQDTIDGLGDEDLSDDDLVEIEALTWHGEASGRSFEECFLTKICPYLEGSFEAIFCWEGGDSYSGYRLKDGRLYECDVEMSLSKKGKDLKMPKI